MRKEEVPDINEDIADIAEAILKVAEIGDALKSSRLGERATLLLLRDLTGMSVIDLSRVLDALPRLKGYIK